METTIDMTDPSDRILWGAAAVAAAIITIGETVIGALEVTRRSTYPTDSTIKGDERTTKLLTKT